MNTYTVKEIADIFKTNPETVRRWIRLGKLKADKTSRKGGNVISEQSLNNFLKTTPKYAGIAASTIGLLGISGLITGVPILTATLLGTMIVQKNNTLESLKNAHIPVSEMLKFINTSIKSSKKTISAKREEISKLDLEIKTEEQHIRELTELMKELKSQCSQIDSDRKEN
ncbi:helix-turn-helix domain-containing protein [Ruminococcus sp.]|uniref:helix-turn-helix domain-containing protein n=1 Tax=Ruminococcus sp. TaxID=41978 RepID=UPI0025FB0F4E|nr:helix-turn-helix domain-containing protein [Ruminococcus sp.]